MVDIERDYEELQQLVIEFLQTVCGADELVHEDTTNIFKELVDMVGLDIKELWGE